MLMRSAQQAARFAFPDAKDAPGVSGLESASPMHTRGLRFLLMAAGTGKTTANRRARQVLRVLALHWVSRGAGGGARSPLEASACMLV